MSKDVGTREDKDCDKINCSFCSMAIVYQVCMVWRYIWKQRKSVSESGAKNMYIHELRYRSMCMSMFVCVYGIGSQKYQYVWKDVGNTVQERYFLTFHNIKSSRQWKLLPKDSHVLTNLIITDEIRNLFIRQRLG